MTVHPDLDALSDPSIMLDEIDTELSGADVYSNFAVLDPALAIARIKAAVGPSLVIDQFDYLDFPHRVIGKLNKLGL